METCLSLVITKQLCSCIYLLTTKTYFNLQKYITQENFNNPYNILTASRVFTRRSIY